jgi:hypothetical protein
LRHRRDSGYDCGNSTECIQADGSGYTVPGWQQIGPLVAMANGHNFHSTVPMNQECDDDVPIDECDIRYIMNPQFVNSTEPWGMLPSLEWLAATATRK